MVARGRRGEPPVVSRRGPGGLVRGRSAHAKPSTRAGRCAPGRRNCVTVSIALPTGALMAGALDMLSRSGLASLTAEELGRQLLTERSGVRVILVRPADVPAYVDHGAADL